jgi:hypothetical protein
MVWFDGNLRHRALQNHEKSSFSLSLSLSLVFLIEIKEEKNFCGSLEPYSSIYGVIIVVFVLKSGSLVKGYRLYRRRWNRKHIWSLGSVLKAWIKQLEHQQPGNKRRSNMIPMVVMEAIVYALDYTQWRFLSYISSLFPTSCLFFRSILPSLVFYLYARPYGYSRLSAVAGWACFWTRAHLPNAQAARLFPRSALRRLNKRAK